MEPRENCKGVSRGFTLIEMLVVVAIVGVITSVIVWNYGDFRSSIVATNMAYEVATSIRESQLYGLGVRGAVAEDGTYDFGGTYGAEFHVGDSIYHVFRDADGNGLCSSGCSCSGGEGEECVEQTTMLQGIQVSGVCAANAAASQAELLASCGSLDELTVSFTRPRPEATVRVGRNGSLQNPPPDSGFAEGAVVLKGGSHCRLVTIYQSGQVSVTSLPDSSCSLGNP